MHSFHDLIEELGGPAVVARAAGQDPGHGRQWKFRDSIPPAYWPAVLTLAEKRGKRVTLERLASMAIKKSAKRPKRAAA